MCSMFVNPAFYSQIVFWLLVFIRPVPLASIDSRLVGGDKAISGQFPWQVFIHFNTDSGGYVCGGAIMNEEWILTAAHCLYGTIYSTARVGTVDVSDGPSGEISTSNFIQHENFDTITLANDIGLLQLDTPLIFDDDIQAIDLGSERLQSNVEIVVSGFGQTGDDTSTSETLNYIKLLTIENSECARVYGNDSILDEMLCALTESNSLASTCFGDSGSPAIVYEHDKPVLVAIGGFISSRGCEYGDPSGFTRVASYRKWIQDNISTKL